MSADIAEAYLAEIEAWDCSCPYAGIIAILAVLASATDNRRQR